MKKIKSVELNLPMNNEWYAVGSKVNDKDLPEELLRVTEIKENSIDAESRFESIYQIYVEEQLYKTIENSPVTVTYFLDGEL